MSMKLSKALQSELSTRKLQLLTGDQIDQFVDQADQVSMPSWPEFMMHDTVANTHWYDLHKKYSEFQFALIQQSTGKWIAVGNSLPVEFNDALEELPDAGWDWALSNGMETSGPYTHQCALAIQILPDYRGSQLSTLMIKIMQEIGWSQGLDSLLAPVRPNKKSDYPLVPMDVYIEWS